MPYTHHVFQLYSQAIKFGWVDDNSIKYHNWLLLWHLCRVVPFLHNTQDAKRFNGEFVVMIECIYFHAADKAPPPTGANQRAQRMVCSVNQNNKITYCSGGSHQNQVHLLQNGQCRTKLPACYHRPETAPDKITESKKQCVDPTSSCCIKEQQFGKRAWSNDENNIFHL